jgi:tetratricopeptide (TPR) repeat protein
MLLCALKRSKKDERGQKMKSKAFYFFTLLVFAGVIVSIMLFSESSFATTCKQWFAKAVSVQGKVEVKRVGETQWQPVRLNDTYCAGDTIRVNDKSRADLTLANQPVLRLDQGSTVTLKGIKEERISVVDLLNGVAHFFSRTPRALEVQTAFVNAGVEGTEFFAQVDEEKATLSIFSGQVLASNEMGKVTLTSGQSAITEKGKAPVLRALVNPRDAVQWTLYYPPVFIPRLLDYRDLPEKAQAMIAKSIDGYGKGDSRGALDDIAELPEQTSEARLFVYRASLFLNLGRANEAITDVERALSLSPNNSDALALRSIIQVTHNQKVEALATAKKAVEVDQKSATARIAMSYAQQANFDLKGALDSVQEATRLASDNALAWARLSELWLSFGETKKALSTARQADAIKPNLARTQTVLGFAYLTEIKIEDSKKTFEKAIELDQTDPLPRLGLGLAKIRAGDLEGGGKDIEIAASLDPNNSLVRSYLGKAYYEEKREKQASEEYRIAKELDPLDPTPYFYDAILKQTTNRPVEALHDLQKAIELNDNRAVYRSKLLMDADLAARSASLGQIYNNLGFQQRALVEGWKSINTDPADFSGHRFLADPYAVLPRHEIARVSEFLQSQLLQPLNITPIQPHLAESSLLNNQGPSSISFNEFNPIFNRNRVALQASSLIGENSTFGEEVVVSGIYDKASFSIGQYHFDTDGFRKNDDLKDSIVNAFLQISPTPQTSIQAEYRYRETEQGDLQQRFLSNDYAPKRRLDRSAGSLRLGFHQLLWPGSDLIGNFMYQKTDRKVHDVIDPLYLPYYQIKGVDKGFSSEIQHLYSTDYIKTIVGAGYFDMDSKDKSLILLLNPVPPPDYLSLSYDTPADVRHLNAYVYSYINFPKTVTWTLGASGDFVKYDLGNNKSETRNKANPKFGVTWNPLPGTTLRGAIFRATKRTLITGQTIEPTQVAGFNQFFDDVNGAESWRYGIAVDQRFSQNLYGGVEFSYRDLTEVPYNYFISDVEWKEYLGRSYLYWSPHRWFAVKAEYLYERFTRDDDFALGTKYVKTHRVPVGLSFHHPSGLSTMVKTTYINQRGKFEPQFDVGNFVSGSDNFWLFDAAVSYRLPRRFGSITVGAKNLFDKKFNYYDVDYFNPTIQPGRVVYAKITLAF